MTHNRKPKISGAPAPSPSPGKSTRGKPAKSTPTAGRSGGGKPGGAPRVTRRQALKYGLYGAAALAGGGALFKFAGGPIRNRLTSGSRPNVILVIIDTLRADHLGCYGCTRANISPRIDALASESWVFQRAISAAPWTLPSVASLLTSQYPSALGIRQSVAGIDSAYPLLPALLKKRGYTTHAIVSADLLAGQLGFARGFDQYDDSNYFGREGITSPVIARKAIDWLRGAPKEPFFLLVHTFDPHYNFINHDGYDFAGSYKGHLTSNYPIEKLWTELDGLTDDDIRYLLALYDSEIAFSDFHVGLILDQLKQAGLYDDSLILLMADHGEEFREHGWIGHTITLHDQVLHVPLIVKLPGGGHRVVEEAVGLIDVAPSLLAHVGIEPAGMEGQAIALRPDAAVSRRPIISETFSAQAQAPGHTDPVALVSVEYGRRKMIVNGMTNAHQGYELGGDPREARDLYAEQAGHQEPSLEPILRDWLGRINARREGKQFQDGTQLLTPEQQQRLHSLGYL